MGVARCYVHPKEPTGDQLITTRKTQTFVPHWYFRPYTHRRRARSDELHCSLAIHYIIFLSPFPPQSDKQSRSGRRYVYIESPRHCTRIVALQNCSQKFPLSGGSSCVRPSYRPAEPTYVLITFCFHLAISWRRWMALLKFTSGWVRRSTPSELE